MHAGRIRKSLAPLQTLLIALLLALAAGCEERATPAKGGAVALESERETLERSAEGCEGEDCASVSVTRELFKQRPALNNAVLQRLLRQLQSDGEDAKPADSLQAVADAFLAEAAQVSGISAARWQLSGEAKQLARRGDLLTVEIDTYSYTGGAHGMPVRSWLNWDLAADRAVSLDQVIIPGQATAFWERAQAAHQRWLENEAEADEDFRKNWPFQRSEDFRFDNKGLVLLYGVYTLGPYALGQVELTLPWNELSGVVRENYLPGQ